MTTPAGLELVLCCDECGRRVAKPYTLNRFQGRLPRVCGDCLARIARGIAQVDRAVRRAA